MRARENEADEVAIHYRSPRLGFGARKPSTALGQARGVAPSPAPPSQSYGAAFLQVRILLGDKAFNQETHPPFSRQDETTTRDISIVV